MSTGGDIDVTIPGSESSVDDAARWLEGLRDNASSAANLFAKNGSGTGVGGEVGLAVGTYSTTLCDAVKNVHDRAEKAADVIRSFADQLLWRKNDMKEHLETASGDGLQVDGNIIRYPAQVSSPGKFPRKGSKKARDDWFAADEAYDNYLAKVRDFEKIKGRVEATFNALNDWIVNNLVTAKKDALLAPYSGAIKGFVENTIGVATRDGGYLKNVYSSGADSLREAAGTWAYSRAADKSHSPSVKTRSRPPSKNAIENKLNKPKPTAMRRTADGLEAVGDGVRKFAGKAVAFGGPAVDLATGAPLAKVAGMTAAGMVTLALLPEAATVGGVIVVAGITVGVAEGVGWLYDNAISLEHREIINHPWEETKKGVGKGVDAVGNWAEDTGKYLEDKASDAWNSASAWTWDKLGI